MGLEKRTAKIIVIVVVVVLVLCGIIGLLLGLLLPQRYAELEVWPRSEEYYTWDQPVIQFRAGDTGSWHPWFQRVSEFLKVYETSVPEDPPRAPCSTHNRREQHLRSHTCDLAMRMWSPCTADDYYGYPVGRPCVFLRLNHVHYWVPEPYNVTSTLPIPPDMPDNLKQIMGEYNSDKENVGPIQYIPAGLPAGFPTKRLRTADRIAYSSRNMPDDVPAPLVGVFFENPRRGVLINVECRIWTRDIYYDRSSRVGRTRFELYID